MPRSTIQLETRIQELLEGALREEHWPELRAQLMESEEARKLYCEYAQLATVLRQRSQGLKSLAVPVPVIPIEELIRENRGRTIRAAMFATAALLMITLITLRLLFVHEAQPALSFEVAAGTQYSLSHVGEAPTGRVLGKGSRLQVSQGTVELQFGSGVKSIVQAPADITLQSEQSLFMREGVAWFQVPAAAVGFEVVTHDLEIVDLGTEFGVFIQPGKFDEVHVFKGKVRVSATHLRKEAAVVRGGQGRRIDSIGRLETVPVRANAFLTTLPESIPYLHWSFDGNDKEIYAVAGNLPSTADILSKAIALDAEQPFVSISGKFGNALSSTGRGGFVATDWPGIEGSAPRTLAYWVKLPPGEKYLHPIVGWGERVDAEKDSSTRAFFSFVETSPSGTVAGISINGFWLKGTTAIADGEWHHIAHVYTGRADADGDPEIYCYIDGELEKTTPFYSGTQRDEWGNILLNTVTDSSNSVPLRIFDHLWAEKREGYRIAPAIDELVVVKGALSSQQIRNLFLKNVVDR